MQERISDIEITVKAAVSVIFSFRHLLKSSVFQQDLVSNLSSHAAKEKIHVLVSQPTLSNQNREQGRPVLVPSPAMVVQGKLPIPAFLVTSYDTKQAERRKTLKEKKEAKKAASKLTKGVVKSWRRGEFEEKRTG